MAFLEQREVLSLYPGIWTLDVAMALLAWRNSETGRHILKTAEQGSVPWKDNREDGGVSASRVGKGVGHGYMDVRRPDPEPGWSSLTQLTEDLAVLLHHPWAFNGNENTRWGNEHEDEACDVGMLRLRLLLAQLDMPPFIDVQHCGTQTLDGHPWVGWSSDGDASWYRDASRSESSLLCTFKIEIKCPNDIYPTIPDYYYDQVQMEMGLSGELFTWFIMWTPKFTQMVRIDYNDNYFWNTLLPRMKSWYIDMYLPALLHARNTGSFPSWLPPPENPALKRGRKPMEVHGAYLASVAPHAARIPKLTDTMGLPDAGRWAWSPETARACGDPRLAELDERDWDGAWRDVRKGFFPSVPFWLPVDESTIAAAAAQVESQVPASPESPPPAKRQRMDEEKSMRLCADVQDLLRDFDAMDSVWPPGARG